MRGSWSACDGEGGGLLPAQEAACGDTQRQGRVRPGNGEGSEGSGLEEEANCLGSTLQAEALSLYPAGNQKRS